jgi:hypothetical protein
MGSTINADYALSAAHKEMLEKSLIDSDPEVAEIMVCLNERIQFGACSV